MKKRHLQKLAKTALITVIVLNASGCAYFGRLADVGKAPEFSKIQNPTKEKGYTPVDMPMPDPQTPYVNANSLWRPGSKGFFKDQRASQVGDILTVKDSDGNISLITDLAFSENDKKEYKVIY